MAYLDWIKNHQSAAPAQSVQNLPDNVKAQAVEAARPAAQTMDKGAQAKDAPVQPQSTPPPSRGRSLGMER